MRGKRDGRSAAASAFVFGWRRMDSRLRGNDGKSASDCCVRYCGTRGRRKPVDSRLRGNDRQYARCDEPVRRRVNLRGNDRQCARCDEPVRRRVNLRGNDRQCARCDEPVRRRVNLRGNDRQCARCDEPVRRRVNLRGNDRQCAQCDSSSFPRRRESIGVRQVRVTDSRTHQPPANWPSFPRRRESIGLIMTADGQMASRGEQLRRWSGLTVVPSMRDAVSRPRERRPSRNRRPGAGNGLRARWRRPSAYGGHPSDRPGAPAPCRRPPSRPGRPRLPPCRG